MVYFFLVVVFFLILLLGNKGLVFKLLRRGYDCSNNMMHFIM